MEFKFKLENIVFYIEVIEDPDFRPQKKVPVMEDDRLNDLETSDFAFSGQIELFFFLMFTRLFLVFW